MRILLTNDDGIHAPGLRALFAAVADRHEVHVVAPDRERSVCGHSCTLDDAFRVERFNDDVMGEVYRVGGTPVDCVRMAVAELIVKPIDAVLSGINAGANVSIVDVSQSGTVAGAREAAFCGIRGIAVSQLFRRDMNIDWAKSTRLTERMLTQLFAIHAPTSVVWNLNLPMLAPGEEPRGLSIAPLSTDEIPLTYEREGQSPDGGHQYRYRGYYEKRAARDGTDVAAVFGGYVCVTPLNYDATDLGTLDSMGPLSL